MHPKSTKLCDFSKDLTVTILYDMLLLIKFDIVLANILQPAFFLRILNISVSNEKL